LWSGTCIIKLLNECILWVNNISHCFLNKFSAPPQRRSPLSIIEAHGELCVLFCENRISYDFRDIAPWCSN
jgi:hypothetical protein